MARYIVSQYCTYTGLNCQDSLVRLSELRNEGGLQLYCCRAHVCAGQAYSMCVGPLDLELPARQRRYMLTSLRAYALPVALSLSSCVGGQSYDDGSDAVGAKPDYPSAPSLRAPDPCDGCYVVNSALAVNDENEVFVASYYGAGSSEQQFLRGYDGHDWKTLAEWDPGSIVRQVWTESGMVWGADGDALWRFDPTEGERIVESPPAFSVWGFSSDDVFALGQDVVYRRQSGVWSEESIPLDSDEPLAIRGATDREGVRSPRPLFLVGARGTVLAYRDEGWEVLNGPTLQVELNDVAVDGSALWAVSGSDQPDGTTGPAALHHFRDGEWLEIVVEPNDALLAVEVSAGVVSAVGARRDVAGKAHAVVWFVEAGEISRVELEDLEAFLWDVACNSQGSCVAVGTDNAFLELDDLRGSQ